MENEWRSNAFIIFSFTKTSPDCIINSADSKVTMVNVGRFELVRSYSTGHSGKVTSVCGGLGSVLTSSSAGDIRVHQPDLGLGVSST